MKRVLTTALASVLLAGPVMAQTAAPAITEDFKRSSVNQPGQDYPQVNSQGYVRFRVTAPDAQAVKVSLGLGGRGGTTLTKGADGAWTGTTEARWMRASTITILPSMAAPSTIRARSISTARPAGKAASRCRRMTPISMH
ncbi:hypothetical protein [Asticcacaulis sp.]|uniref:hypothetical protein n=1 Tax=Asticcacaulis sp. TaxID=1872648 RepID=UPI003F7C6AF2